MDMTNGNMEIVLFPEFPQIHNFSFERRCAAIHVCIKSIVHIRGNEDQTSPLSLSLRRQNKFFISVRRKNRDSSFFSSLAPKNTSWSRREPRLARRRSAQKFLMFCEFLRTIYALLSGVNNNQPFPSARRKALNPIADISLSHPLRRIAPGVILNYKRPLHFGNERSVLPATDSFPRSCNFFASLSRVFV